MWKFSLGIEDEQNGDEEQLVSQLIESGVVINGSFCPIFPLAMLTVKGLFTQNGKRCLRSNGGSVLADAAHVNSTMRACDGNAGAGVLM